MRSYKERKKAYDRYNFLIELLEDLRDDYVHLVTSKDTDFYNSADKLSDLELQLANVKTEVMALHYQLNGYVGKPNVYTPTVVFHWLKDKKGVSGGNGYSIFNQKTFEAYSVG